MEDRQERGYKLQEVIGRRGGEREVYSHLFLLQQVEDKLHHDVVLNTQQLCHTLRDPRLDCVQAHLAHVNLQREQESTEVGTLQNRSLP